MKPVWRYLSPLLFGLLLYASIRIMADITTGNRFWTRPWQTNATEILTIILLSYTMLWMTDALVNQMKKTKKGTVTVLGMIKEFLVIFLSNLVLLHLLLIPLMIFTDNGLQVEDYVIGIIIPSLYVLLYFAITRGNQYLKEYISQKIQLEKISNDHLQTELKFLKAQYHPHFLFNALNTVYFQMDEDVAAAKKTVEKFSELLRYQLYDQQQMVPVSKEIQYLTNYIDIQKIRTSEKLKLNIDFDRQLHQQKVYPLLFLPLVENALKYIGGDYTIEIEARYQNNEILFSVKNTIPEKTIVEKPNGIGLENLRRRLVLLYPDNHLLEIKKTDTSFSAVLKLNLTNP